MGNRMDHVYDHKTVIMDADIRCMRNELRILARGIII